MKSSSDIESQGFVDITVEDNSGNKKSWTVKNTVLRLGRIALAKTITNELGDYTNFYVMRMIFGTGGTESGQVKLVNTSRTGLYCATVAEKSVISNIDTTNPTQAIFTTVLSYADANGYAINEMALVLNNGDLYSMTTFADLNKTDQIQITFNWRINYI